MSDSKQISDSVWHRVVQIIQEAMLEGVDCADLLRQVRVVPDDSDPNVLVLSPEYQQQVKEMHEKLLQQAEQLQAARRPKLILGGDGSDNN